MTERSPSPLPPVDPAPLHRPKPFLRPLVTSPDALNVIRNTLLLTEGRDKIVKLLQYTSRLILLVSSVPSKRLRPFISQMSMTRKVLKLGHGIYPYSVLLTEPLRPLAFIRVFVEILNDFWDDVYCLSRIGFLRSAKVQRWSETWANRAWMTGIVIDLLGLLKKRTAMKQAAEENKNLEVGVLVLKTDDREIVREKMRVDAYWNDMSIIKLFADLGFCGIYP
jgi:hypothetical protein